MHLILTGATGLVGSATLDAMLKMKDITKISILSRKPVPLAAHANDPRVHVHLQEDFGSYSPELLSQLNGAAGAVWALGISQNQVSKDEYVKITRDYTLAGARAFADLAPADQPFRFVFVSGMGATTTPGRSSPVYARVKGETELLLSEMRASNPRFAVDSVRPAGVDPSDHEAIKPFIPVPFLLQRLTVAVLLPPMRMFARGYLTPTEPMGRLFVELAMGKHDTVLKEPFENVQTLPSGMRILENTALRRLGNMV